MDKAGYDKTAKEVDVSAAVKTATQQVANDNLFDTKQVVSLPKDVFSYTSKFKKSKTKYKEGTQFYFNELINHKENGKNVPYIKATNPSNNETVLFKGADLPTIRDQLLSSARTTNINDVANQVSEYSTDDLQSKEFTLKKMNRRIFSDGENNYTLEKDTKIGIQKVDTTKDKNNKITGIKSITIDKIGEKSLINPIIVSAQDLGTTNANKILNMFVKKQKAKSELEGYVYKAGGMADFTGPAWLDGTKKKPEAVLNASQTNFLKNDLLGNKNNSLMSIVSQLQDTFGNTATGIASTSTDDSVNIENVSINFNAGTISNDYDARRAGELVKEEMLRIARKAGNRSVSRR